ncbi:cyclase family protein [Erwinia sp. 9145]|uniref:cyclase family protein n=1 Tax=Erwinia sp. 9145 TaxID=1500895 RepID=UPI0009E5FEF2|nr:cyclase family protein [Erwinia sp. 9145]
MTPDLIRLFRQCTLIELNHAYEELMPVWTGHGKFFCSHAEDYSAGDGNYNCQLSLGDHCGTHVDAPAHFIEGGKTVEQIDARQLIGRGRCLDMSCLAEDSDITVQMIQAWEADKGEIVAGDIVIFRTGYDKRWRCRPHHAGFLQNWPGLSGEGANYLIGKGVTVLGTDAMSLDRYSNDAHPAHFAVLGSDCLIVENLANLEHLPSEFVFMALPLRIKGASASPIRAVALLASPLQAEQNGQGAFSDEVSPRPAETA